MDCYGSVLAGDNFPSPRLLSRPERKAICNSLRRESCYSLDYSHHGHGATSICLRMHCGLQPGACRRSLTTVKCHPTIPVSYDYLQEEDWCICCVNLYTWQLAYAYGSIAKSCVLFLHCVQYGREWDILALKSTDSTNLPKKTRLGPNVAFVGRNDTILRCELKG